MIEAQISKIVQFVIRRITVKMCYLAALYDQVSFEKETSTTTPSAQGQDICLNGSSDSFSRGLLHLSVSEIANIQRSTFFDLFTHRALFLWTNLW